MNIVITSSSLIEKFYYDEEQQVLHIYFRRGGHYGYSAVTPEKFQAMHDAESHGKFFLSEIKPNHQFSKYESGEKAYTIMEIIALMAILSLISLGGFLLYAICHFISKFW
jgi:hypothetical protein